MLEIRLVAPSMSLSKKHIKRIKEATSYFKSLGYNLTEGKYLFDKEKYFGCSSINNRVSDLMEAFLDKNVAIILCATGGYNVNQILPYLDYDIIAANPKIIIGYSDITALLIAIYKQTKILTYYGPMLSDFSSGIPYTLSYFEKILKKEDFYIKPSKEIIDYKIKNNIRKKVSEKNSDMKVIQPGIASGTIIAFNLCTINLLQGTSNMPELKDVILFVEDDADIIKEDFFLEFSRNFESLLQLNGNIKGIVFGRFQKCSEMTISKLKALISKSPKLKNIPIVSNANFGHTKPIFTIPIGAFCKLNITSKNIEIKIEMENNK